MSASPGASGTSSGCRMWASSSRPSTIRGPGPREVGRGVDGDDLPGAERGELRRGASRPRGGRSARRSRRASRSRCRAGRPRPRPRCAARSSRRRKPSTSSPPANVDQLRRPVPGRERWIEPFERHDARAPRVRGPRGARGRSAPPPPRTSSTAASLRSVAWASVRASPSTSPTVCGSSEITCGLARDLLGDRAHVVVGDRADRAQCLGDDQVGLELVQRVGVELVDRLAGERALLDGRVDLRRSSARRAARRA